MVCYLREEVLLLITHTSNLEEMQMSSYGSVVAEDGCLQVSFILCESV